MNGTLLFYKCMLTGGVTQRWRGLSNPTGCSQILFKHFALKGGEDT